MMKLWLFPFLIVFTLPCYGDVDLIKVDKSKRRMYLIDNHQIIKEYRIALGKRPQGPKRYEGDQRTPEGLYRLDYVMEDSGFYRSIHIDYPNIYDVVNAHRIGASAGGNIKIHGLRNGERRPAALVQSFDWTDGCIAITNREMDELLSLVKVGTPIHIEW